MPDLRDGETVEVKGSGAKPYQLKNVGGVYSCTCPAWRNQSVAINQRTCKHLRKLRGDDAEAARIGTEMTAASQTVPKSDVVAPELLLAESWNGEIDPSGFWLSEKLDGVRAYWNGKSFLSRNGNPFIAPEWFTKGLPDTPLDGELWIGRKQFQRTVSIVRRSDASDHWNDVRYLIFDAPTLAQPFEQRTEAVMEIVNAQQPKFAQVLGQTVCRNRDHLDEELERIESLGGEGLMLRLPGSLYVAGRSNTLLKVKSFLDCEATVIAHEPGKGRHKGRLGALAVELSNGIRCQVGTGLTDFQRKQPPAIGSIITLKYQELTNDGIPRFPVFAGIRSDISVTQQSLTKESPPLSTQSLPPVPTRRRFEFVQGNSRKFWEIAIHGNEIVVVYGRIGTVGSAIRKPFANADEATKQAEKLIREKTDKGYIAV